MYGTDLVTRIDGSSSIFYHTDGLGSTRLLTDANGIATDSYSYDAFGGERSHSGSSGQEFTYTGEQVDPEAGLVYLRARYYDALTGRFLSKDIISGFEGVPLSLNRYAYSMNNPISKIDLTGMTSQDTSKALFGDVIGIEPYRNSQDFQLLISRNGAGGLINAITTDKRILKIFSTFTFWDYLFNDHSAYKRVDQISGGATYQKPGWIGPTSTALSVGEGVIDTATYDPNAVTKSSQNAQIALRAIENVVGYIGKWITPGTADLMGKHYMTDSLANVNTMRREELEDYRAINSALGIPENTGLFEDDLR